LLCSIAKINSVLILSLRDAQRWKFKKKIKNYIKNTTGKKNICIWGKVIAVIKKSSWSDQRCTFSFPLVVE